MNKTVAIFINSELEIKYLLFDGDYRFLDKVILNTMSEDEENEAEYESKVNNLQDLIYRQDGQIRSEIEITREVFYDLIRAKCHLIECGEAL